MEELKDENERTFARICGRNIRRLRESANYTQEELAGYLGCSVVSIGRVERGVQTIKTWRLIRLCDLFHVSLDYLVRGFDSSDLSPVPSYVVKLYKDADETELEMLSDLFSVAYREVGRIQRIKEQFGNQ